MVDLIKTDNATEEDIRYGIYNWAKLFKATTWEELKEMSEQSYIRYKMKQLEELRKKLGS